MQIQHEIDGKYLSIKTETAEYSIWVTDGNVRASVRANIQKMDDEIHRTMRRRAVMSKFLKLIS